MFGITQKQLVYRTSYPPVSSLMERIRSVRTESHFAVSRAIYIIMYTPDSKASLATGNFPGGESVKKTGPPPFSCTLPCTGFGAQVPSRPGLSGDIGRFLQIQAFCPCLPAPGRRSPWGTRPRAIPADSGRHLVLPFVLPVKIENPASHCAAMVCRSQGMQR